jgi:hypothetical protein
MELVTCHSHPFHVCLLGSLGVKRYLRKQFGVGMESRVVISREWYGEGWWRSYCSMGARRRVLGLTGRHGYTTIPMYLMP